MPLHFVCDRIKFKNFIKLALAQKIRTQDRIASFLEMLQTQFHKFVRCFRQFNRIPFLVFQASLKGSANGLN